jgi:HAD superfamily hydrolase (TIGR01549 family)
MVIKTVIFDLDGTITEPFLDFDAIRTEMGFGPADGPILELMENMNPEELAAANAVLHKHETEAVERSTLNDGAAETLDKLRAGGINIGILTRNTRNNALAIESRHRLKFDAIVAREDGPVKPDAFGVLKLCESFKSKPEETMVVGDFLYDLLSAKAAGAISVLINNHRDAKDFRVHADYTINSLTEIVDIIERLKI